jgi:cell division FtsZ-interacting protein ZapD
MDPPVTTERLSQINQLIRNVENAKRERQQTLVAFLEHVPAVDQELVEQRIQQLLNGIRTLEEQGRTLIRERDYLIVGMASSIRGRPGGNN